MTNSEIENAIRGGMTKDMKLTIRATGKAISTFVLKGGALNRVIRMHTGLSNGDFLLLEDSRGYNESHRVLPLGYSFIKEAVSWLAD